MTRSGSSRSGLGPAGYGQAAGQRHGAAVLGRADARSGPAELAEQLADQQRRQVGRVAARARPPGRRRPCREGRLTRVAPRRSGIHDSVPGQTISSMPGTLVTRTGETKLEPGDELVGVLGHRLRNAVASTPGGAASPC